MINHTTADNENVVGLGECEGFIERSDDGDPRVVDRDVGENDIFAIRERFAEITKNGFVSVFTHEYGFSRSGFFEIFKVGRKMPWEFVAFADDTIPGDGSDDR